ncbi:406_t:CDS:2, partial [Cetraspora pellucida]
PSAPLFDTNPLGAMHQNLSVQDDNVLKDKRKEGFLKKNL